MTNEDDESSAITSSRILEISQVISPSSPPNLPPLEAVKSNVVSESGHTMSERPQSFSPLWREVTIVLLCCCGPITQVIASPTCVDDRRYLRRDCWLAWRWLRGISICHRVKLLGFQLLLA